MKRAVALVSVSIVVLLAAFFFLPGETPGAAPQKSELPAPVRAFLAELGGIQNADQAALLLKRTQLTRGEMKLLEGELAKPSWASKLETIRRSVRRSSHPPTPVKFRGQNISAVLAGLRLKLRGEREEAGRVKMQKFLGRLAAVRNSARPPRKITLGATRMAGAQALLSNPGSSAAITSVNPGSVTVGQTVAISGRGFGDTPGRVVLRTEHEIIPCEVVSWDSQRIQARVTRELFPWEGMEDVPDNVCTSTGIRVYLWVKLAGGETGPWTQISVSPDTSPLVPTISSVTPENLGPGCDLLIEGDNFGEAVSPMPASCSGRTRLEITFRGQTLPVEVSEWRNSYIVARLAEDISGIQALSGGVLEVRNRLHLEAVKGGLSFTPEMEVADIERGPFESHCEWSALLIFCLVGQVDYLDAYDLELRNGWKVSDRWIEIDDEDSEGPNFGGYFEHPPEIGGTGVHTRVVAWCDAFSWVSCRSHVLVTGPKGTSYE